MDDFIPRDAFSGDKMNPGLALFVQNQQVQKKLALEEQLKNAEISAMMERAKMSEEGATERTNINRTSAEEIAAGNRASIEDVAAANRDLQRDIHTKDHVTKEQIQQINDSQGTNYPVMDMPMSAFVSLQANDRAAKSQEAIAARQAQSQDLAGQRFNTAEARRLAHEDRRAADVLAQQGLTQGRMDQAEAEKRRGEQRQSVLAEIKGALNANPNAKTGLPTAFDPGQALVDNPTGALDLLARAGQAGGLPKEVPVTPIKPYGSYESPPWFSSVRPGATREYQQKEREFNANVSQAKSSLAPPSTGHGGASMTKGVPQELSITPQPTPAATQQVPSAMGGFPSKVGAQPIQPAPGPSAISPPSTPQSPGPDYKLQYTDKGAKSWFNPKTGDRRVIPGAQ